MLPFTWHRRAVHDETRVEFQGHHSVPGINTQLISLLLFCSIWYCFRRSWSIYPASLYLIRLILFSQYIRCVLLIIRKPCERKEKEISFYSSYKTERDQYPSNWFQTASYFKIFWVFKKQNSSILINFIMSIIICSNYWSWLEYSCWLRRKDKRKTCN